MKRLLYDAPPLRIPVILGSYLSSFGTGVGCGRPFRRHMTTRFPSLPPCCSSWQSEGRGRRRQTRKHTHVSHWDEDDGSREEEKEDESTEDLLPLSCSDHTSFFSITAFTLLCSHVRTIQREIEIESGLSLAWEEFTRNKRAAPICTLFFP